MPTLTSLFLYERVIASASNLYQSYLYVSKYTLNQKPQLQKKINWLAHPNCAEVLYTSKESL